MRGSEQILKHTRTSNITEIVRYLHCSLQSEPFGCSQGTSSEASHAPIVDTRDFLALKLLRERA